jgi:hypothetical protein
MFNRMVVQKALNRSWAIDSYPGWIPNNPPDSQGSVTSLMIYDIFGGEILKTHKNQGWHFYNRIDGERIDFTSSEKDIPAINDHFEDLPSDPSETYNYFEDEEYSSLFMKFIRAYEEFVGEETYQPGLVD